MHSWKVILKVLDAATKLKITAEEDDEDKIILKAIMDVNLPKFSSSDTKLFKVSLEESIKLMEYKKTHRD